MENKQIAISQFLEGRCVMELKGQEDISSDLINKIENAIKQVIKDEGKDDLLEMKNFILLPATEKLTRDVYHVESIIVYDKPHFIYKKYQHFNNNIYDILLRECQKMIIFNSPLLNKEPAKKEDLIISFILEDDITGFEEANLFTTLEIECDNNEENFNFGYWDAYNEYETHGHLPFVLDLEDKKNIFKIKDFLLPKKYTLKSLNSWVVFDSLSKLNNMLKNNKNIQMLRIDNIRKSELILEKLYDILNQEEKLNKKIKTA